MSEPKVSYADWQAMLKRDPVEAIDLARQGSVSFPPGLAEVYASHLGQDQTPPLHRAIDREQQRPRESLTLEQIKQQSTEQQAAHDQYVAGVRQHERDPAEGLGEVGELPADTQRITFDRWRTLSKTNPAKARDYHAAGLVDYPDHIATSMGRDLA